MRLNFHARIEISLGLALLLGSCDNPNSPEHLSARIADADANARTAISATNDLESRVEAIEQKLDM